MVLNEAVSAHQHKTLFKFSPFSSSSLFKAVAPLLDEGENKSGSEN